MSIAPKPSAPTAAPNLDATVVGGTPAAPVATVEPVVATVPPVAGAAGPKKVSRVGDYELVRKLGQGGMGTVFLANQVSLDRLVALKTLSKELANREDFVARFLREMRSMAKLDHPNVVRVYAADSSHGLHFAAIEYVDGRSMQKWMDELGKLSVGDALLVTLAAADALRHAHDLGMIHRDVKPDNVLVTKRGVVKVADFGLAKAVDEDVSMTQSGTGLGTPLYMAPEQARNAKRVDKRTDVYALGCTLYYFLTGRLPFEGKDTLEVILAKEAGRFTSVRKLNPEVPERLDLMLDKMLAKDPNHRYADCGEVIKDLTSLKLANVSLSFVDDALPTLPGALAHAPAVVPAKKGPPTRVASSRDDAAKARPVASPDEKWFVLHDSAKGQAVVSRMTTEQVLKAFKGGLFDLKARAKRGANDEFLPLAQFPEFEAAANAAASRIAAQKRGRSLSADFAKLEKQDRWRKRLRPVKAFFSGLGGLVSLLIWLGAVGGVLFAAWYFGWSYVAPYLGGAGG